MRKLFKNLVLVLLACCLWVGVSATSAFAVDPDSARAQNPQVVDTVCGQTSSGDLTQQGKSASESQRMAQQLPAKRWSNATGEFHLRTGGFFDVTGNIMSGSGNMITGFLIRGGNFLPDLSVTMAEFSGRFCPLNAVGDQVDRAAGSVIKAIFATPVIGFLIIAALLGSVVALARSGRANLSSIGQKILIIALLSVMAGGATASTGGGGVYKPGVFSPGWFLTTIDRAMGTLSSVPAALSQAVTGSEDGNLDQDMLHCDSFIAGMKNSYRSGSAGNGKVSAGSLSSVPASISATWEQSGMRAWTQAQFGDNFFAEKVGCRLLEANSGVPFTIANDKEQKFFATGTTKAVQENGWRLNRGGSGEVKPEYARALAWDSDGNSERMDRKMIAWAACKVDQTTNVNLEDAGSFTVDTRFWPENKRKDAETSGREWCVKAFTKPDYDGKDFDIGPGSSEEEKIDDPVARDYVMHIHGRNTGQGMVGAITYLFSGIVFGGMFILMAGGVIVAKLFMIVIILIGTLNLIGALFGNTMGKALRFFMMAVGICMYTLMVQLAFSTVAAISSLLQGFTSEVLSGTIAIAWSGLVPVIAMVCVLQALKAMGLPSLLNPFAAISMTNTIAAGGAAAIGAGAGAWASRIGSGMAGGFMGGAAGARKGMSDEEAAEANAANKAAAESEAASGMTPDDGGVEGKARRAAVEDTSGEGKPKLGDAIRGAGAKLDKAAGGKLSAAGRLIKASKPGSKKAALKAKSAANRAARQWNRDIKRDAARLNPKSLRSRVEANGLGNKFMRRADNLRDNWRSNVGGFAKDVGSNLASDGKGALKFAGRAGVSAARLAGKGTAGAARMAIQAKARPEEFGRRIGSAPAVAGGGLASLGGRLKSGYSSLAETGAAVRQPKARRAGPTIIKRSSSPVVPPTSNSGNENGGGASGGDKF
ncbi:hypothetical protein QP568_08060 [Propionimicrobium lymphophilum]|uniref:hypothetical protein n=1 Tax=Propionimicrobium lymphophilum TaxID=33012 RepID=UPI00254E0EA1|nr:hypothetical protein [Propionimicrobium lymphophilum]MDK7710223.1 hypothetical protein [Propionimicrobium lymphophilum]MDK7734238.1 hypothetical protein [Propionimicrobium lymphophilum]